MRVLSISLKILCATQVGRNLFKNSSLAAHEWKSPLVSAPCYDEEILFQLPLRRDKRLQSHVLRYKHWNNAKKSFLLVFLVCLFVCLFIYLLFNVFNLWNRNKLCQIPRTSKHYWIKGIIMDSSLLPISRGLGKITLTIYHSFINFSIYFVSLFLI